MLRQHLLAAGVSSAALLIACPAPVWAQTTPAPVWAQTTPAPVWAQTTPAATKLDPVTVTGTPLLPLNSDRLRPLDMSVPPARDGGDLLRSLPGVSLGRMGGHGVDPSIRGQKDNQLTIVTDGAMTFGGCPNRMDPPTASVNIDLMDSVTVTRGYSTVANGPGAPGGVVKFERKPPKLTADKPYRVNLGGGYDSNGSVRDVFADAAMGHDGAYVRGGGQWRDAHNYADGRGRSVRSAFTQFGGGIEAGLTHADGLLSLGYDYAKTENALFAGAGMDGPLDETNTLRLKMEKRNIGAGALDGVRVNAYGSLVDHVMDNFSLRRNTGTRMLTDAESDTYGGQAAVDLRFGEIKAVVGIDALSNRRVARRYMKMMNAVDIINGANLESLMWPNLRITQLGGFGEATIPLAQPSRLIAGVRYDHVGTHYGAADEATRMNTTMYRTANDMYAAYYGVRASNQSENNVGGVLRYEHDLGGATVHLGVSRAVRTADATERGMAAKGMGTGTSWVGNPNIKPEAHHQIELGARATLGGTPI